MSWKGKLSTLCGLSEISWFDFIVIGLLFSVGFVYLDNMTHWSVGLIGEAQYGDAEFWWNGALHVARGIFNDNPGKGYRPGYFLLTGLTLPVLGSQFKEFFPYLLLAFLSTTSLLYLTLSKILGRWVAACCVFLIVVNPYTAEWLATSTTDGTGLILHMAALACLLLGVTKGVNRNWLIAFGVLFSLATLTRPLVTPFIGLVLLALLVFPQESFKKRLSLAFFVLIAFCTPTFLWMTTQKLTIDQWTISKNDASAFYAASDPDIQVWTPGMYDHIQKIAGERNSLDASKISDQILNQTFWQETTKNYFKFSNYHLSRLGPHVWSMARFSPIMATHGTNFWRILFLEMIAAGLTLLLLFQRKLWRVLIIISLGIALYFYPAIMTYMVLGGVLLGLFSFVGGAQLGIFLLALYWLTGVVALYLVGGTWGKPSYSDLFALNALGYRLGSQIFFVGDILAAYLMVSLAYFSFGKSLVTVNKSSYQNLFFRPQPLPSGIILGFFALLFLATVTTYGIGGYVVAERAYANNHMPLEPYPSLVSTMDVYKKLSGYDLITGKSLSGKLDPTIFSIASVKAGKTDIVFTGVISSFIWNLPGQQRAQILVYAQNQVRPYTMGPGNIIIDVPSHLNPKDWIGLQGAFIIHNAVDDHNKSNLPYYLTGPSLRAFIPLTFDAKDFALDKIIWFPLVKNATQLATSGELTSNDAITWSLDSGEELYQRRFFITAQPENKSTPTIQLILNVTKTEAPQLLSFSYKLGDVPAAQTPKVADKNDKMTVTILAESKLGSSKILVEKVLTADNSLQKLQISIPSDAKSLKIACDNLVHGKGIWFYEFNLSTSGSRLI